MDAFCPSCGVACVGAFRFCASCGQDLDALSATVGPADHRRSRAIGRRPTRREFVVSALVVVVVGLAAIGSLKPPGPGTLAAGGPTAGTPTARPTPRGGSTPRATVVPPSADLDLAPTGETEPAEVVRVVDGDTIVVAIGGTDHRLRYIGMDAPETGDALGAQATAANRELVLGQTVFLERDVSETDRFGRLLRHVWLKSGAGWTLVNRELVRLGVATASSYPPDTMYDDVYEAAQSQAKGGIRGLWGAQPTAKPTPRPTARATPKATPRPTPRPTKKPSSCHPSYSPCLPIVGDLNCPDVRAMGKDPVDVIGPDDYRLDGNNDGVGCE